MHAKTEDIPLSQEADDLVQRVESEVRDAFSRANEVLTFDEYLAAVALHPYRHTRTAYQYIRDAILHFGVESVKECGRVYPRFGLFRDPFFGGQREVVGQVAPIAQLFKHIDASAKQEEDESIYVLIGPPGTGKSRIFTLLQKGMEEYSRTSDGAVYSVNWLFRDLFEEDGAKLGFRRMEELSRETGSYAHLPESEIFAKVECQVRDHPLILIPRRERSAFLQAVVSQHKGGQAGALRDFVIPQKVLELEPCRNCQIVRDRLLEIYHGDWKKVTKHIQVARFIYSLETGRGLAEVDPGVNVETSVHPVSTEEGKIHLSALLRGVRLYNFYGKPTCANRGFINYQDIFNKNHQQLQHLLSAVEEKTVDFGDVTLKIDCAIFGSTNLPESKLLEENVLTEGLRDRIEQISVPYLLNFHEEERIYEPNVREIRKAQHISPHSVSTGAMFVVLTRLCEPNLHEFFEAEKKRIEQFQHDKARWESRRAMLQKQQQMVQQMSLVQKAKIYAGDFDWIAHDQREAFTDSFAMAIRAEHADVEGKKGRSPRWFKRILGQLSMDENNRCINPFQVYSKIHEAVGEDSRPLLDAIQTEYNRWVITEVERALFEVRTEDLEARVESYLRHAKAYVKREMVMDEFRKKNVDPVEHLQREEEFLGVAPDQRHEFRVGIIQKFGKHAAETGERPDPRVAVPELISRFREKTYLNVKSRYNYDGLLIELDKFDSQEGDLFEDSLPKSDRAETKMGAEVLRVINTLRRNSAEAARTAGMDPRAGYCNDCARKVVKYVLTNEHTRGHFRIPAK